MADDEMVNEEQRQAVRPFNVQLSGNYSLARMNNNLGGIVVLATGGGCSCTPEMRAGVVPPGSCDVLTCVPCAARTVVNSIVTFKFPDEGW